MLPNTILFISTRFRLDETSQFFLRIRVLSGMKKKITLELFKKNISRSHKLFHVFVIHATKKKYYNLSRLDKYEKINFE
jgi:hypothetical protein